MKILFLVKYSKPFVPVKDYISLIIDYLEAQGHEIEIYDVNASLHCRYKDRYHKYYYKNNFLSKLLIFQFFKNVFMLKRFLKGKKYDIIHLFSVRDEYLFTQTDLKESTKKLIGFVYGSDFVKSNKRLKFNVFKKLDLINFASDTFKSKFNNHYNDILSHKTIKLCLPIDKIENIEAKQFNVIKNELNILVGSASMPYEQHFRIIEQLKKVKTENFKFVFLLNCGNHDYINKLKHYIKENLANHEIVSSRVPIQEYSELISKIDIHLNLRTHDHLTTTMLETLYTGSYLIAGAWLPYEELEKIGIHFTQISGFDELPATIIDCAKKIRNGDVGDLIKNHQIIKKNYSPESVLKNWQKLYKSLEEGR